MQMFAEISNNEKIPPHIKSCGDFFEIQKFTKSLLISRDLDRDLANQLELLALNASTIKPWHIVSDDEEKFPNHAPDWVGRINDTLAVRWVIAVDDEGCDCEICECHLCDIPLVIYTETDGRIINELTFN